MMKLFTLHHLKFFNKLSIFFIFVSISCSADVSNQNTALTVSLTNPQRIDFPTKLTANGNIAAWQETIIGSELSGLRLSQVLVNIGDVVKKGQLLAVFSADTIVAELAQANGNLAEAQVAAREAKLNAERAHTLVDSGALSNQQLDQYANLAETAKARLEVSKATADIQKIRLRNTKIYAPDDGVISSRTATVGSVISSGNELFRLIRQSRLEWRAEVISSDLSKIKVGIPVKIVAADGTTFTGKVRRVSPVIDIQTRNALVYVDLPTNIAAKAGMFASGEFMLSHSKSLVIPQESLVMRDGFNYVFIVKDNHVRQIKVQIGRRIGKLVEVVSGLAENQKIVTKGVAFLTDNDLVKVILKPSLLSIPHPLLKPINTP